MVHFNTKATWAFTREVIRHLLFQEPCIHNIPFSKENTPSFPFFMRLICSMSPLWDFWMCSEQDNKSKPQMNDV